MSFLSSVHQACKLSTGVHWDRLVCDLGLHLSWWSLRTGEVVWWTTAIGHQSWLWLGPAAFPTACMAVSHSPLLWHRVPPTETVLLELLQCASFPRPAALHELLHHWVLSSGSILQEQAASDSSNKPAPVWTPLSIGPQVLPGACSSVVFRASWPPLGTHLLQCWGSPVLRLGLCCLIDSSIGHNLLAGARACPVRQHCPGYLPAQAHGTGCYQVFQARQWGDKSSVAAMRAKSGH